MAAEISLKKDSLAPTLRQTLRDGAGNPLDLSSCDVTFRMRPRDLVTGELKIDNATAAILGDPAAGRVEYVWLQGDTDTAGYFVGEWVVTYPGQQPLIVPSNGFVNIRINPNLGAP